MKVRLIGPRNAGPKLVGNLLRNGHDLIVFDLDAAKRAEFVVQGAGLADSASALKHTCDVLNNSW